MPELSDSGKNSDKKLATPEVVNERPIRPLEKHKILLILTGMFLLAWLTFLIVMAITG